MYKLRGAFAVRIGKAEDFGNEAPQKSSFFAKTLKKISADEDPTNGGKKSVKKEREFCSDPDTNVLKPKQLGYWDTCVALLVVLQVVILPYTLAFDAGFGPVFSAVETLVDMIFVVDVIVQFNLSYKIEYHGEEDKEATHNGFSPIVLASAGKNSTDVEITLLETRRYYICRRYLRGWFFIDLLAVVPFMIELVFLNVKGTSGDNPEALGFAKALRVPRLLRLLKVARVFYSLGKNGKLRRFLLYSRYTSVFRLAAMILVILLVNHFLACMWWSIAKGKFRGGKDRMKEGRGGERERGKRRQWCA